MAVKEASDLPPGFVEWEAVSSDSHSSEYWIHILILLLKICVTLYDWRTFPETFAKSTNPDEKALYKLLKTVVGPQVIDVLIVSLPAFVSLTPLISILGERATSTQAGSYQ